MGDEDLINDILADPGQIEALTGRRLKNRRAGIGGQVDAADAGNLLDEPPRGAGPAEYNTDGTRARIDAALDHDPAMRHETPSRKFRTIRVRAAMRQIVELPAEREEILLILTGTYHGWDFIPALLELAAPATIAELHLSSLGAMPEQIEELAGLMDAGQVTAATIVLSTMYINHNKEDFARMSDGRRFSIHGSLNIRRCHSFEQAAFTADPATYEFFRGFVEWMHEHPTK